MKFLLKIETLVDEAALGATMAHLYRTTSVRSLNVTPEQQLELLVAAKPDKAPKPRGTNKRMTCREMIIRELKVAPAKSGALSKVGVANGSGASTAYTTLADMLKSGEVMRASNGIYSLVQTTQSVSHN